MREIIQRDSVIFVHAALAAQELLGTVALLTTGMPALQTCYCHQPHPQGVEQGELLMPFDTALHKDV